MKSLKGCDCSPHKQNRVGNIGTLYLAYPSIGRKKRKRGKKLDACMCCEKGVKLLFAWFITVPVFLTDKKEICSIEPHPYLVSVDIFSIFIKMLTYIPSMVGNSSIIIHHRQTHAHSHKTQHITAYPDISTITQPYGHPHTNTSAHSP